MEESKICSAEIVLITTKKRLGLRKRDYEDATIFKDSLRLCYILSINGGEAVGLINYSFKAFS